MPQYRQICRFGETLVSSLLGPFLPLPQPTEGGVVDLQPQTG